MKSLSLKNIETIFDRINEERIVLDINWIEPIAIAFFKSLKKEGFTLQISATRSVREYIDAITIQDIQDVKNKTFIPPKNFTFSDDINRIAEEITKKLISQLITLNEDERSDFKNYINYSVVEVMQNVLDHSQSEDGGFVAAQVYPNQKRVQIAISDCGIGFLNSLKYTLKIKDEEEAIYKALESNVTGSKNITPYGVVKNAGIGLYALSKIIEHSRGNLMIISNDTLYKNINGTISICKNKNSKFKGVVVGFEIFESNIEDYFEQFKIKHLWKLEKEDEIF